MKKLCCFLFILAAAVVSLTALTPRASAAGSVTDTISVSIGYFGWDESQFVQKASFTWQELDDMFGGALTTHETVYSYYSGGRTYLVAARGFYIRDLLEYAGVDFGSISRIDFFTKDQTVGAYRSFTKESLFDLPRYYFPNLAAGEGSGNVYPYYGDDILDGAVQVEPMLALEDYTEWDSVGSEFEKLYERSMFSAASRFHLFFGQLAPTEANTSSAAKYVYKLFITFSGTPVLSTELTNIELKVGSEFHMTVNVAAEDSALDSYVRDNLVWSSDNDAVVTVDNSGNLKVTGEGDAAITARFGGSSVTVNVRVSADETQPQGGGGTGGGQGGPGLVSGDGTGGGTGSATGGTGDGTGTGTDAPGGASPGQTPPAAPSAQNPATVSAAPAADDGDTRYVITAPPVEGSGAKNSGVYTISPGVTSGDEFGEWVNSVLGHKSVEGGGGGLDNARTEAMDDDARQLILFARDNTAVLSTVMIILAAIFIIGFGLGILSFRRELQEK